MDEEPEVPVFRVIKNQDPLIQNSEKSIIYFTVDDEGNIADTELNISELNESEETTSYLVQDNAIIQQFGASTVFNSDVKIVTLDNERFFYITTDDDENVQSIEPHLITSQDTDEQEIEENESTVIETEENELESVNPNSLIKLEESYKLIMMNEIDDEPDYVVIDNRKKSYKCLYMGCGKMYSTSYDLTVHTRSHMKRKPYPCPFQGCEKTFATHYSLTAHRRTHTGEKPYTCQICSKSFKTSGDLQKHVRTHTGEKPFLCPIEGCGKSFTTSNIRKVHVRSHTGERPYLCDYPNCGKAFSSSTNYKNHARIHSGEKPYACKVEGCDKKFTEYSSLHKHNGVHQLSRPFECNYCKQTFKSEHTLNVHRKVKHGVLVSPDGMQLLSGLFGLPSKSCSK